MSAIDSVYSHYPRKVGPRKAKAAIEAYMKRKAKATGWEPFKLALHTVGKTIEFSLRHARAGTEKQYIPHASTWFNRDGPDEDPNEWGPGDNKAPMAKEPTVDWVRENWDLVKDYGIPFPPQFQFKDLPSSMRSTLIEAWDKSHS